MSQQFRTIEVSDPRFAYEGLHYIAVKAPNLRGRGDISVFLPEKTTTAMPLVVLLHGVYGSHWVWSLKGGVHRTAARLIDQGRIRPMILAMPSDGLFGDGSGYLPHSGRDYEKWVVDDVPAAIRAAFSRLETGEKGLFVAGLSMGGFGALRLGAKYPERFRGFAGHSSITELSQMSQLVEEPLATYAQNGSEDGSVFSQMLKNKKKLPPFRFDCGREDNLLAANRTLHQQLLEHHISHEYEEYAGSHEWAYWEEHIGQTLLFFDRLR